jgi:hypothetical protein
MTFHRMTYRPVESYRLPQEELEANPLLAQLTGPAACEKMLPFTIICQDILGTNSRQSDTERRLSRVGIADHWGRVAGESVGDQKAFGSWCVLPYTMRLPF